MTYYIVMVIDLSDGAVIYKSRATASKALAKKIYDQKGNGGGEDLNPPNGFLPLLIPITIPVRRLTFVEEEAE